MCFESAHIVPKLFNFWNVVTSLRIAYDGPRGPSQATRLCKHKNFVSCKKSFSADGIQTKYHTLNITLSPCAVESYPTPGDSRGSSSPSRSISGVSSHVANRGSDRIPLESVHPSLPWSSSLSRSIHSSEHHVIFHPSCSHHVSKVA